MNRTARRFFQVTPIIALAVIVVGLVWYNFYDHADSLSSAILHAERIDIKVDDGASPTGIGCRYTLSDDAIVRKIAHGIERSSHSEYIWGVPAVDGTVTVLAFEHHLDATPNAHVIFAFTGDTYSYDRFHLGVWDFHMDSTDLYRLLAEKSIEKCGTN